MIGLEIVVLQPGTQYSDAEDGVEYSSIPSDLPWVAAVNDIDVTDWRVGLSPTKIARVHQQQHCLPVRIHETLYLSDARSVRSIAALKSRRITRVLNMAGAAAAPLPTIQRTYHSMGIAYKEISAPDDETYPLLELHLKEALEFLHEDGTAVSVVHCSAGLNRSGLIACIDFMLTNNVPVVEAVAHLRRQRGNMALGNEGLQKQLVAFARAHNMLGDVPRLVG